MSALTEIQISEVQQIERAMDELLKAATATTKAPWPPRHSGPVNISVLVDEALAGTKAERAARVYLDNPVAEAVRRPLRTFGERLHEIGGTLLMEDALYRVAAMDPAHESWRIDILDKRFDGIGTWAC
jgi:hypothetical protein